ncbi:DUF3298 and DUF4163 domain-containing protein [Pseudobutyrivibrio ruminis]|uniref:DUF3298 and DUF4163 domain-containing protein n=1 Tax=Pseudobutyrivibrio ruminis TaxID=46206 RepID=UPI0003F91097|nr:DUF3298 and DUF4163 domain-containing protein [Pseudobutyrivibrio ruminis]
MKKRIAIALALTMALAACIGCGKNGESDNKDKIINNTKEEGSNTQTDSEEAEVSVPEYAITSVSADGYDYFEGSVECIQITDGKHEALTKAIDDLFSGRVTLFNEGVDSQNDEAKQMNEEQKEYADEEGLEYEPMKYSETQTVSVVRADENILSFVIDTSYYSGGAHGSSLLEGFTFDVNTGEQLSISNYGDESKIAATSKDFIFSTIEGSADIARDTLFDDDVTSYKSVIEDYFSGDTLPENYLDHTGITFMFQQYDIAPYAGGIVSFTVPYSEFEDFNEAYLPAEGFYTEDLSIQGFNEKFDVNNDGTLEDVCLLNSTSDDGSSTYELNVGGATVSRKLDDYAYASGTYIHGKDGNYILVSVEGKVILFEVSKGIRELGYIETDKSVKEINNGEIVLAEISYENGGIQWGESETHKYSKAGLE